MKKLLQKWLGIEAAVQHDDLNKLEARLTLEIDGRAYAVDFRHFISMLRNRIESLENSHANLEEALCDLKAATCPDLTPAKRRTRK